MKNGRQATKSGRSEPFNSRPDPTWSVARLARHFGVPPERLLLHPRPGMATEDDLIYMNERGGRLCELVDGVLVEKAMGFHEGFLAGLLLHAIAGFTWRHKLGIVLPGDASMRLFSGLVRMPDVSFVSWDRMPGRKVPDVAVADFAPDLAVEVVSKSNTKKEIERKLDEYFNAGVRLVWLIYPNKKMVEVYTSRLRKRVLRENDTLDGGRVLPGFKLSLAEFFAPRMGPPKS
jgi:Uma2 family endonuclease